jgi:hypothetical protein
MTQTFNEDVVFNDTALFKDEVTFQDSAKATFKKETIFEDALKIKQDIICDVRAWGAKGDGTTDDTSAIQDAINSLDSQGGIVFLPPGTYLISSALEIKRTDTPASVDHSFVSLIGSGRGATVIKLDSNFSSYALKIYGKNSSMSLVKAVVKDFSIDGNNQSNADGGIMLENARFWTLENIEITKIDNSNAIGVYIKDSFNISCKHCRVAMGTSSACKGDAGYKVYSTAGVNNATGIIFFHSLSLSITMSVMK